MSQTFHKLTGCLSVAFALVLAMGVSAQSMAESNDASAKVIKVAKKDGKKASKAHSDAKCDDKGNCKHADHDDHGSEDGHDHPTEEKK